MDQRHINADGAAGRVRWESVCHTGKASVTEAEARAYVKKDLETNDIDREDSPLLARINGANAVGEYNEIIHFTKCDHGFILVL